MAARGAHLGSAPRHRLAEQFGEIEGPRAARMGIGGGGGLAACPVWPKWGGRFSARSYSTAASPPSSRPGRPRSQLAASVKVAAAMTRTPGTSKASLAFCWATMTRS